MALRKFPYGYSMSGGELVICEDEAETIRRAFAEFLDGRSMYSIALALFSENYPYFNDTKKKAACKVSAILRDRRYSGADGYPAIIPPEVFERAEQKAGKAYAVSKRECKTASVRAEVKQVTTYKPNDKVKELESRLGAMLIGNCDSEEIRDMILRLAAEKYSCIQ